MLNVLTDFGFGDPDLSTEDLAKDHQIIRMGVPPFRIKVLTTISGVNFDECFQKRVIDMIDGVNVNIISIEHLKSNKRASGRHKDLADLDDLP